MTDEILRELIEFIENASPVVWSALLKQVYVDAFAGLMYAVALAVIAVVGYKIASKTMKGSKRDYDWYIEKITAGYSVCFVSSVIAFVVSVDAVTRFINPEFYAIRFILMQIGGGG